MSTQGAVDSVEKESQVEAIGSKGPLDTEGALILDSGLPGGQAKKKAKNTSAAIDREPGKSLLPFARVQKIIKADKEVPMVAKEAVFLISLATEEFIKRLCEEGRSIAEREKRSTVQYKDIATAVRKVDEFFFLEEIIPWVEPVRRKPQVTAGVTGDSKMLDQFLTKKGAEDEETDELGDIVMNADGTMGLAE